MTTEDAIKELEQRLSTLRFTDDTYVDCVNGEALEMAIEALKKQEPTEVKEHHLCPVCGKDVIGSWFYCWKCGQHLKWKVKE